MNKSSSSETKKIVAVVGAGAAGLVMARELTRMGHAVTVYEQSSRVGGVWVYEATVEDDLLGLDVSKPVFSSLYDSLRTNLPRDLMAFGDYTFDSKGGGDDNWQRYPHHSKVLEYLENFARDFDILPLIQFNSEVTSIKKVANTGQKNWLLETKQSLGGELFDAVVVCNGHYSKPKVPELAGIEHFKGKLIHSHNYRNASAFKDKKVLVIGAAASGVDISREVSEFASDVVWSGDRFGFPVQQLPDGRRLYPNPDGINQQGRVYFAASESVETIEADVILFCTGYEYQFPFLEPGLISIDDNWVSPLYKDIVVPDHPSLAFIGLPYLIVPFPLFEMQARWFARLLADQWQLPDDETLETIQTEKLAELEAQFALKRHYHQLGEVQASYINDLALECGVEPLPQWFHDLANEAQNARLADPFNFRDQAMRGHGPTVTAQE